MLMQKGGTSHKHFMFSFSITREGKHLKPHILVSKRKNKSDVPPDLFVDNKKIGIWNEKMGEFLFHCHEAWRV